MADRKTQALDHPSDDPVKNTVDLDEISLTQALLDVEVANARVIDLTKRLTAMNKEMRRSINLVNKLKDRNRKLTRQLESANRELEEIKASRAFRSASSAQRVVRAARSRIGR